MLLNFPNYPLIKKVWRVLGQCFFTYVTHISCNFRSYLGHPIVSLFRVEDKFKELENCTVCFCPVLLISKTLFIMENMYDLSSILGQEENSNEWCEVEEESSDVILQMTKIPNCLRAKYRAASVSPKAL